jgi:hypothetical protein
MGKKLAIGCSIAAGAGVLVVVAVVALAPTAIQWAKAKIAEEQERQQLADQWQPPAANAGPETLFPAQAGGARLTSQDEQAAIPDLDFDLNGRHAVYRVGANDVEVFVYRVSELEKEALFQRVEDAYDKGEGKGSRKLTKMGYRCYYASPEHRHHLWFMKGWLFVFRTRATEDQEPFVKAYLKAVSARPPAETKTK